MKLSQCLKHNFQVLSCSVLCEQRVVKLARSGGGGERSQGGLGRALGPAIGGQG